MVKSGAARAANYALKYDVYVLMLRAKRVGAMAINNFLATLPEQLLLEEAIQQIIVQDNLVWGQTGRFYDLARTLYNVGNVTLQAWLDAGLTEAEYDAILGLHDEFKNVFYLCVNPTSKLISTLSVFPLPQNFRFQTMQDWLTDMTLLSEQEANAILDLNQGIGILDVKVCVHASKDPILAFLQSPIVTFTTLSLSAKILNPNLQLTAMGLLKGLVSPAVTVDIYGVNAPLQIGYVAWLQWGESPIIHALAAIFATQNLTPTLSAAALNPNLYNESPTLNSSVVKTP